VLAALAAVHAKHGAIMPSLGPSLLPLRDPAQATGAESMPGDPRRSAGKVTKQADPYQEVRRHLIAAMIVVTSVAVVASYLFLR
jgi:hypothetical protein